MRLKALSIILVLFFVAWGAYMVDKNTRAQIKAAKKPAIINTNMCKEKPAGEQIGVNPVKVTVTDTAVDTFTANITAYCSCEKCTGKKIDNPSRGITASGLRARSQHTIAADKRFPFGTQIEIEGIVYTVEDRGGAIKGNKLDVYTSSHEEALKIGRKQCKVKIIRWGDTGEVD